jgi:hypothetical protein
MNRRRRHLRDAYRALARLLEDDQLHGPTRRQIAVVIELLDRELTSGDLEEPNVALWDEFTEESTSPEG